MNLNLLEIHMTEDLYLEQLKLGPMENFVYIIGSKSTREVALIDPAWEIDRLYQPLHILLFFLPFFLLFFIRR